MQSYQELHLECRAVKNYTLSAELYQFQFCIKNHALLERERVESAELYQFQFCIKNHALLERERVESAELYQFQFCIKNYTLLERERVESAELYQFSSASRTTPCVSVSVSRQANNVRICRQMNCRQMNVARGALVYESRSNSFLMSGGQLRWPL